MSPGMQHRNSTTLNTVMCIAETSQYRPHRLKHQLVKHCCVPYTNFIQTMRQGEYDVVMLHRQGRLRELFNPQGLFGTLTLRTMPVATTIIAVAYLSAAGAYFLMTTQCCGTTLNYVIQGLGLTGREIFLLHKLFAKALHYMGQFVLTSHDDCISYPMGYGLLLCRILLHAGRSWL